MPRRVPMRIYILTPGDIESGRVSLGRIPDSQFLVGLDDSNIRQSIDDSSTLVITVRPENVPDPAAKTYMGLTGPDYTVYSGVGSIASPGAPSTTDYYVLIGGRRWYIRKKSAATYAQGTPQEVFEFYVNPKHIEPVYKKLITKVKTLAGWEVVHWGAELTQIRVSGQSGGLHRIIGDPTRPHQVLSDDEDITMSTAWQRLNQLKAIYDKDHAGIGAEQSTTTLGLSFFDRFYVGFFEDFTGPIADAEKPYLVDYAFTFTVEKEYDVNSLPTTK